MASSPKQRRQTPLIVYCSRTDNTHRVAAAMAESLAAEKIAIDQLKDHQLRGRPLIGLGSGVYWFRLDRRIVDLAARIPSSSRVFIFSTSGWGANWLSGWPSHDRDFVRWLRDSDPSEEIESHAVARQSERIRCP